MFRKIMLALAACAAFGVLVPTNAFAHWRGHHHHWGPRAVFYGGPVVYNPCLRKIWVATPFGMRLRWVNVCVY